MRRKMLLWVALVLVLLGVRRRRMSPEWNNADQSTAVQDQPVQYTEENASPAASVLRPAGPSATVVQGLGYTGPLPLRSAARIMRVWVAPWESMDGVLHLPNYLYTEVQKRKWSIGGRKMNVAPQITPLADQSIPQAPDKAKKQAEAVATPEAPGLETGPKSEKHPK